MSFVISAFAGPARVIGEYIVTRGGRAALLDLIRAHGDVNPVFGVTPDVFEKEMYAWIRTRYL